MTQRVDLLGGYDFRPMLKISVLIAYQQKRLKKGNGLSRRPTVSVLLTQLRLKFVIFSSV